MRRITQEMVDHLDAKAGKQHSVEGSVMTTLHELIELYEAANTKLDVNDHAPVLPFGGRPAIAQVGWLGHSGEVYSLHDDPSQHERGGFSPLYIQLGTWEPIGTWEPNGHKVWRIKD